MRSYSIFVRSRGAFLAFVIVGEILTTVAVALAIVTDYGAPIGNLEQILAWTHHEAAAGKIRNILVLVAAWLFLSVVLAIMTALRFWLEPNLQSMPKWEMCAPKAAIDRQWFRSFRSIVVLYLLTEIFLTGLCALFVARAGGFQWGFGGQAFFRLLMRGSWWQDGLAPACYPALLVWGVGSAFLVERAWSAAIRAKNKGRKGRTNCSSPTDCKGADCHDNDWGPGG